VRRVWTTVVVLSFLCASAWSTMLGDLNGDGVLDDRDLGRLDEIVDGGRFDEAADVDLDGRVEQSDRDLLEFVVRRRQAPDAPLTTFFTILLGRSDPDGNLLQRSIERASEVPRSDADEAIDLLLSYLASDAGRRRPAAGTPGADLRAAPRDAALLMAVGLLQTEAAALTALARRPGTSAFETADLRRSVADRLRRLEAVLDGDDGSLGTATVDWVRPRLDRIDQARAAAEGTAPVAVPPTPTATPTSERPAVVSPPTPPPSNLPAGPSTGRVVLATVLAMTALGLLGGAVVLWRRAAPPVPTGLPVMRPRPAAKPRVVPHATQPLAQTPLSLSTGDSDRPERYRVKGTLGEGGQGAVLLARDTKLNRDVAIKVLKAEVLWGSVQARRMREGGTLASMRHPAIPQIYDLQHEPKPYMVMEFVHGTNLRRLLDQGRPDVAQALDWLRQLLEVLAHCHDKGVLHRDVKPMNVIVDGASALHLIDFGLVRRDDDTQVTQDNHVVGTFAYLAPEQFKRSTCTPRSEVYSAGLVGFELLTGSHPFPSSHPFPPQVFQQPLEPAETAPDLAPELCHWLKRMMAREPADRPATMRQALDELGAASGQV